MYLNPHLLILSHIRPALVPLTLKGTNRILTPYLTSGGHFFLLLLNVVYPGKESLLGPLARSTGGLLRR